MKFLNEIKKVYETRIECLKTKIVTKQDFYVIVFCLYGKLADGMYPNRLIPPPALCGAEGFPRTSFSASGVSDSY